MYNVGGTKGLTLPSQKRLKTVLKLPKKNGYICPTVTFLLPVNLSKNCRFLVRKRTLRYRTVPYLSYGTNSKVRRTSATEVSVQQRLSASL